MKSITYNQANTDNTTAVQNYAQIKPYNPQNCECYPFSVH